VFAEIVLDGFHVHPVAARIAFASKGPERLILVTDANQAAGMPDGEYQRPGNRTVYVRDGVVRVANGGLAGSTLTMDRAVRNAEKFLSVPLEKAVKMASTLQAMNLGFNSKGLIKPGMDADIVILSNKAEPLLTVAAGEPVFQSSTY
jgi:N-acetylglucosamine-6-phosphate deacetylase